MCQESETYRYRDRNEKHLFCNGNIDQLSLQIAEKGTPEPEYLNREGEKDRLNRHNLHAGN